MIGREISESELMVSELVDVVLEIAGVYSNENNNDRRIFI